PGHILHGDGDRPAAVRADKHSVERGDKQGVQDLRAVHSRTGYKPAQRDDRSGQRNTGPLWSEHLHDTRSEQPDGNTISDSGNNPGPAEEPQLYGSTG